MNLKKKLMAFAVSMGAMMLVVSPLPVRAAEVDSQSYSVLETEIESNEVYMDTTSDEQGKMAGSAESTVPADTEEIASGEVQESQTETADSETADNETADSETADSETADSETAESDETDETDETVQEGIVTDADGSIYYYENGEKFTGGYKEIADEDGNTVYYYFQKDGRAYTNGLLELTDDEGTITYYYFQSNGQAYTKGYKGVSARASVDAEGNITPIDDDTVYYYYFQKNGQAYTDGLLEFVHTNGKTYYYYFQSNGQAYTNGYKGINSRAYTDGNGEIEKNPDHRVYYYYFQINGQAYTNGVLKFVHTNGKTYYYYFQSNGQAYTNGYKALNSSAYTDGTTLAQKVKDNKTYYYYFQKNGQAFRNGFLQFVHTNGKTYYYYFQPDGKAFTGGYKAVSTRYYTDDKNVIKKASDTKQYQYYFQSNGQAYTKGYLKFVHTNKKTYIYYFQTNGRAFTGGWKNAGGKRYYFDTQGHGYTGWKKVNNKTCYFNADGEAQRGWSKVKGSWYYFDLNSCEKMFESSVLHNAWLKINSRSSSTDYYIVVDRDNTRTMIFKGSKGHWIPIYDWKCSVGAPSTPTVTGTFTVGAKGYSFGDGYTCYYYTQFYGDYLFHSVLYHEGTFNVRNGRLGAHISHGCIRLKIENAKWIYDNIPSKTKVYIY